MSLPLVTNMAYPWTHWPYYTKRLGCWWVHTAIAAPVLLIGPPASVPVWRLTPTTFSWFWAAVENLAGRPNLTPAQRQAAAEAVQVLLDMDAWLTTRGLAMAVRKALRSPVPALPAPPVDFDVLVPSDEGGPKVDASFNARGRARKAPVI